MYYIVIIIQLLLINESIHSCKPFLHYFILQFMSKIVWSIMWVVCWSIDLCAQINATSSMCLHDQFPIWFSLLFIYLAPLLNIYSILMFKHHLLSPLFQIPKLPPQPRKLVISLGNYLTLSINLTNSHEYGKCD